MLTVPEAARQTGKNPETIRRWIREGKLAASKVGTQHMIAEQDLRRLTAGEPIGRVNEAPAAYASAVAESEPATWFVNAWLPAIVGRIVHVVDPVRIILLGARALGMSPDKAAYELLVVLDDVPDRMAARVAIRRSFIDLPVPAEIAVASATEARTDAPSWLADGRSVYERDVGD